MIDTTRMLHEKQDTEGRRVENRLTRLEGQSSHLAQHMMDLQQQVSALTEKLKSVDNTLGTHRHLVDGSTVFDFEDDYPYVDPAPPQPAADDAEKWEEVHDEMCGAEHSESPLFDKDWGCAKAAVAEAVKQGLVMRPIDPTNPDLVRVVEHAMTHMVTAHSTTEDDAKSILSALAVAMGGTQ